ncbi:PadR family transcriptional regulator [Microbaculum marinum]|uniref:PadR family transcriptional regulator n=1 Tax=Microbaculum marinum TaxID=1764581 RepID=A0AAW9RRB4_9HYPH
MNARTLCLAILNFGEATGYEIRKKSIEGEFSYFVDTSFGAIYPALSRLTDEGLVECRDEVHPGKPARKVYSITPKGRDAFVDALNQPIEQDVFKSPFLLTAMCCEFVDPKHMAKVIDERIEYLKNKLEFLSAAKSDCDMPGAAWTLHYGSAVFEASYEYLVKNRDALIAMSGSAQSAEAAE